ncbi:MAG: trypsin-like serine protease [Proteobacteria bacterium]|nr:trypsin-like serine protease [Pseudomonadota bacterium]
MNHMLLHHISKPIVSTTLGLFISIFISCKHAPDSLPQDLSQPLTYGGKEYSEFTELPPYFVTLARYTDKTTKTRSFCSGAHIGDGYILTAAHCLTTPFLCSNDSNLLYQLSIRYISPSNTGELKEHVLTYENIESIVIHKKYFGDSSVPNAEAYSTLAMHDIALIKVRIDDQAPFAGVAYLPTTDEYSTQHLDGVLYLHGIGRELYDPGNGSSNDPIDRLSSLLGALLHRLSYFGGSVEVVKKNNPQFLSYVKELNTNSQDQTNRLLFQDLKNLRDSPRVALEETPKESSQEVCFGNFIGRSGISGGYRKPFISHFMFSRDGQFYRYPQENDFFLLERKIRDELQSGKTTFSDKEIKQYVEEKLGKAAAGVNFLGAYYEQKSIIHKWLLVTTSGPVRDKDRVIKSCRGDSGGPVVRSVQTKDTKYIHVGVAAVTPFMPNIKAPSQCGTYLYSVNTFAHLDWIEAAKDSMALGNHSYQDFLRQFGR